MALPPPIHGTEEYLAAVHDRLGEQNDLLAQILDRLPVKPEEPEPSDVVELREPAAPADEQEEPDDSPERPAQSVEVTEPASTGSDRPTSSRARPARKRTTAKKIKES